jgi:hypothetical protein
MPWFDSPWWLQNQHFLEVVLPSICWLLESMN